MSDDTNVAAAGAPHQSVDSGESLLSLPDFKKQRVTRIENLVDALEAGGRNSDECTLILTEGDSGRAIALAGISVLGQDYGVLSLKRKCLNIGENHKKDMDNAEVQKIMKALGLDKPRKHEHVSVDSLRYGHLLIMANQGDDGPHFTGKLIRLFHLYWPSLLKIQSFIQVLITPIVKAKHQNGEVMAFYSMPEYESWRESLGSDASGWTIKFYKGLAASTLEEGREYFIDIDYNKKDLVWVDEQDDDAIKLAFSKKATGARKNWLGQFEPGAHLDQKENLIRYSDFVYKVLMLSSMEHLQRSIPSMVDGLKPAERKILFCAFERNLVKELLVSHFSGYVYNHSAYCHGRACLESSIVSMAQDFVGSNNLNLLKPNGQFGSRRLGGKDHGKAWHIYTQLSPITRYLFPKDDDNLLHYLKENGRSIEPIRYVPVIPTVLVNGCKGIGTGWSTFIPNYNPRVIIANIRRFLNGEQMEPMDPWYKGFRGKIEKSATKDGKVRYTTTGIIQEIDENTLHITELPVGQWTGDYCEFLKSVVIGNYKAKDPFIKDFLIEYSSSTPVHFEVTLSKEDLVKAKGKGLLKVFKLTSTFSISNMHLFNSEGRIKRYNTPEEILKEFCDVRLAFYVKRKEVSIAKLELELVKLENQVRLIHEVLEGTVNLTRLSSPAAMFDLLEEKGFTPLHNKTKVVEPVVVGASVCTEETDDFSRIVASKGARASDYQYLLSMPGLSFSTENVQQLRTKQIYRLKIRLYMLLQRSVWYVVVYTVTGVILFQSSIF